MISLVIPNSNNCKALQLTLESLCRQTYPASDFEVIVVDQASTDGSRELVKTMKTPFTLRLLEQAEKYGISVSRNAGMEAARSPIVLILDADILAAPGVVEAHVQAHQAQPGGLVCGRILPYPPSYTSYIEQVADIDQGLDRGNLIGSIPFYQASGGHLSLSVETYRQIGPWDPTIMRVQDIEFACRAVQMGFPIYNCPLAVSYHNHSRSLENRLEYVSTISWWPVLYQRYPQIKGTVPWISDFEPIEWGVDSFSTIKRKSLNTVYGLRLIRYLFIQILKILNHYQRYPRIVTAVYWRLYTGTGYTAFRAGMRRLASQVR
jgi:glycosyltransferase involved in cell wall biosynthesis